MSLVLPHQFLTALNSHQPFNAMMAMRGDIYNYKAGGKRITLSFSLNGQDYFIKKHFGVGWREIIKNLIQGRKPITGADNEWQALHYLPRLGIDTMTLVGYGSQGIHPATRHSFVITKALKNVETLESFCEKWPTSPISFQLKSALITKVADIARRMHQAGVVHRDLYLCHFYLDLSKGDKLTADYLRIFLIDLHRMQRCKKLAQRWLIKDVASLYFSSMNIGLTQRDLYRFLIHYFQCDLRTIFSRHQRLLRKIEARAKALYQKQPSDDD